MSEALFCIDCGYSRADLKRIAALETECFGDTTGAFDAKGMHALLTRSGVGLWVARVISTAEIVGYIITELTSAQKPVEIVAVGVTECCRGNGLASRLLNVAESSYTDIGLHNFQLQVWSNNPAQLIYFKHGYRTCGFKRSYYNIGMDAMIMRKAA